MKFNINQKIALASLIIAVLTCIGTYFALPQIQGSIPVATQPPIADPTVSTQTEPTMVIGLNCSFIDALITKGDVIQTLDVPTGSGFYAGVQIRLISSVDVPAGWIVHRDSNEYYGPVRLESGAIASIWAPESCRPLNMSLSSSTQIAPGCAFVTAKQLEELKNIQDVATAIKQAEEFAGYRQNDYVKGSIIPAGVLIATDLRSSNLEQFGVVPINNQGGWGLFLTTRELQAPKEGTYWCIR